MPPRGFLFFAFMVLLPPTGSWAAEEMAAPPSATVVLSDFSEYPEGWKARGGQEKADAVYRVVEEEGERYLKAEAGEEAVRIFKKIPWNPLSHPVIEWRWRVKQWPAEKAGNIYLYVSLDRDFFGIPTITKYAWNRVEAGGEKKEGGMFRPTERVIRSGEAKTGEWVTETIDALGEFREIAGRDPRGEAYGIGILVDPGIEADFGPIRVLPEE